MLCVLFLGAIFSPSSAVARSFERAPAVSFGFPVVSATSQILSDTESTTILSDSSELDNKQDKFFVAFTELSDNLGEIENFLQRLKSAPSYQDEISQSSELIAEFEIRATNFEDAAFELLYIVENLTELPVNIVENGVKQQRGAAVEVGEQFKSWLENLVLASSNLRERLHSLTESATQEKVESTLAQVSVLRELVEMPHNIAGSLHIERTWIERWIEGVGWVETIRAEKDDLIRAAVKFHHPDWLDRIRGEAYGDIGDRYRLIGYQD